MKKLFLSLLISTMFFLSFGQRNQYINQLQTQAKQAYQKYANATTHQQIKNQKVTTEYNIDDVKYFWRWDLTVMPPTWQYEEAVCKAVGNDSYIFVSTEQWNVNINQDDIDTIMSFLEDSTLNTTEYGIVSMDTMLFGNIPDELDNDPKVIFYFTDLGSYNGTAFDGYFSAYNQLTEAEAQQDGSHSNECEMLYMSCYPVNPTQISTLSVLSHELQHLIHFGYDQNEETWLNEGCSELAMVSFGYPDPISSFNSNPNNNLIVWDQQWSDYVQVQLFFTYMYELFGNDFMKSIVHSQSTGVQSINETLINYGYNINFKDIFDNWTLANFINDKQVDNGQYGYDLLDLPAFSYVQKDTYPINIASALNNCAARYYKIPHDYGQQFDFNFENPDNWNVNLLFYDENDSLVEISQLDINQSYIVPQAAWNLNKLFFTLSNHFVGTGEDTYVTDITYSGANTNDFNQEKINLFQHNNELNLIIPSNINEIATINIYDVSGKIVYSVTKTINCGINSIKINTQNLINGVYIINITSNTQKFMSKFVI